jgi:hypothetical protein
MGTKRTMTMTAFAKLRGVSRVTAHTWRNRGYIVMTDDRLVDVARSNALLDSRPDVYRGGVKDMGGTPRGWDRFEACADLTLEQLQDAVNALAEEFER